MRVTIDRVFVGGSRSCVWIPDARWQHRQIIQIFVDAVDYILPR